MISFIHSLFALLFRGAFLLLMLLIFLLICFNFLSFKIFLPAFLPCLFLKNLACSLVVAAWYVRGRWLPACLGACALVVGRLVVTCVPWSLCLGGSCLGGWRLLVYLGACALELVPWWLAVTCIPWSLCLAGWCVLGWCAWWWLPACLGARALVVGAW